VDFIEPYLRTPLGFDFRDLHLDLIKLADGTIYLKDEEAFEDSVGRGEITSEQASAVRVLAGTVHDDASAGFGLFDGQWLDWEPPESWRRTLSIADDICAFAERTALPSDFKQSRASWLRA
jgi:hypothetical protein